MGNGELINSDETLLFDGNAEDAGAYLATRFTLSTTKVEKKRKILTQTHTNSVSFSFFFFCFLFFIFFLCFSL